MSNKSNGLLVDFFARTVSHTFAGTTTLGLQVSSVEL